MRLLSTTVKANITRPTGPKGLAIMVSLEVLDAELEMPTGFWPSYAGKEKRMKLHRNVDMTNDSPTKELLHSWDNTESKPCRMALVLLSTL